MEIGSERQENVRDAAISLIEAAINKRVAPFRRKMMLIAKSVCVYQILGTVLMAILATLFAAFISYAVSIISVVLFSVGYFMAIVFSKRRLKELEVAYIFNLALVLENLNRNIGEVFDGCSLLQKGYRLKPGHLGQWIEVHRK